MVVNPLLGSKRGSSIASEVDILSPDEFENDFNDDLMLAHSEDILTLV